MTVHRLIDSVEINWEALTGPTRDAGTRREPPEQCVDGHASLHRIRGEDLACLPALRQLHAQAVTRGLLLDSEAGFIGFLATAAYCLRVADDPAALFAHCVRSTSYPATLQDEDRAIQALKRERVTEANARRWLIEKRPDPKV